MENIRIGRRNATDEQVMQVAKLAQCDEFVRKMPNGYRTVIGENGRVIQSGKPDALERQSDMFAQMIAKQMVAV